MIEFYRYVNNDQDYIYTTDPTEAGLDQYCQQDSVGYIPENEIIINGTVLTTKLFRYVNSNNHHFYTIDPNEATAQGGWMPDGPGFYYVFAQDGKPDPPALFQGPPDARIAIDAGCSSATLTVNGQSGQTSVSGTVDLTIGPNCTGPMCSLTIGDLQLAGADFKLVDKPITQALIRNAGYELGSWMIDNTYIFPTSSSTIFTSFNYDGDPHSFAISNNTGPLRGTLNRDYSNFTLTGDFSNPSGSVHISLCGHAVGYPPVAVISPLGPFQCDSPSGAHVTFSSEQSHDPDNDIIHRLWRVNNLTAGEDVATISTLLTLGQHPISLTISDSRGATSTATEVIIVKDTTPPQLKVSISPNCLWPPNHKYILFSFGNGITAQATDVCDSSPSIRVTNVTSNQPPLSGGSGNTVTDFKFGPSSFCVRAERDGTLQTPREYTVTIEAADSSGNKTSQQVIISVPHDQGQGTACDSTTQPTVEDNDPHCTQ
jgi:hypothetical protein